MNGRVRLKITTTAAGTVTTIKIEGELLREGVSELDTACGSVDGPISLDLSDLATTDAEGMQALKKLLATGAQLLGASPYIKLLLESEDTTTSGGRAASPLASPWWFWW